MNEQQKQQLLERISKQTYVSCRQAMRDELLCYHEATISPLMEMILNMNKSLGLLLDGQALIEKTLGGAFDDDEPWKQSLDD